MPGDGFGIGSGFFEEMGLTWLIKPGQCTRTPSVPIVSART